MSKAAGEAREGGRAAAARYAWIESFDLLKEADEAAGLDVDDLAQLAEAAWWTGRLDECIAARERAFALTMEAGDPRRAALVAMALAKDYFAKGASSIGTAWINRAERLLAEEPDCVEQGYLARLSSVIALEGAGDYDAALGHARREYEFAQRFQDKELLALALHDQGRALVMKGDVAEGMALVDEATAPALAGELSPYTTGVIYCNTITACKELADYGRAGDWTEAAKRWCERQAIAGFPGMCRVYRASIMLVRGAWPEAEQEARLACEELKEFNLSYAAEAFYELGEIRMGAGDLPAAAEAFKQAHELGRDPQPGLALLRLHEGNVDGAAACLEQALEEESGELHRARLLPALVEVGLKGGNLDTAQAAADELEAIAARYGTEALRATAGSARAKLFLARGDVRSAAREARQVLRLWHSVDAPYEVAQARMILARAYAGEGNVESAILELDAAVSTFDRLGALPAARESRMLLEDLGASAVSGRASEDRATRTFMFTDIARSTNLVEAIGDEAWTDVVRWHDQTLRSLFAGHGGEEIDHAGDGFFVAFGDAASAVECAVAVQRTLAEHRRTHGFSPQVRIGLHTADATRQGSNYRGKGVHQAARIAALANGGEILAGARAVSDGPLRFAVSEPRRVELQGISDPIDVVAIDWHQREAGPRPASL
jgi:class 3 adenylate cyclase